MSNFHLLGDIIRSNIVNALGWKQLQPLQDLAIPALMNNEHSLLLAPTAGGKTEAAMFPLLSRLYNENWKPTSVVYICPLKALLTNLEPRLRLYSDWLGATVGLWHGDVARSRKSEILSNPPDILLITPESIEVILTSKQVDPRKLFGSVKAVVVDEIHAFAGDDRGWHLLSVIDRIQMLVDTPIQRIGLSATLGNPDAILSWLTSGCSTKGTIINPPSAKPDAGADIQIDYVGSISNAATVISQLHSGKKRLVFCDSRSKVESLAAILRQLGVTTFVSHSSLSSDERRRAEDAFAEARNCVIVATSTLELGIDVGDLDYCIQIDSPHTVSSFLQRSGRTGRRKGYSKNCLFLATSEGALVRAISIVSLWENDFVEPVIPPALPYTVAAQQIMALSLQRGDRSRNTWQSYLPSLIEGGGISQDDIVNLTRQMCDSMYLDRNDRLLSLGENAEKSFSYQNWKALYTVFSTSPTYSVYNGRDELGSVHGISFSAMSNERPVTLSLAGRSWLVKSVSHAKKKAFVEPSNESAKSLWLNSAPGLTFSISQAIKSALCGQRPSITLSNRANMVMDEIYSDYDWISMDSTTLLIDGKNAWWWTYGGAFLNTAIVSRLPASLGKVSCDSFSINFREINSLCPLQDAIESIMEIPSDGMSPIVDDDVLKEIKFLDCIPDDMKAKYVNARFSCTDAWRLIKSQPVCRVSEVVE